MYKSPQLTQSRVKQLINQQFDEFFSQMKVEIESKIKQIDSTLMSMSIQIQNLQQQVRKTSKTQEIDIKINMKAEQIYIKLQELRKYKQNEIQKLAQELRNKSIDRSYDRKMEKSPLFKRHQTSPSLDLNSVLFGIQNKNINVQVNQIKKSNPQKNIIGKPPLPNTKPKVQDKNLNKNYVQEFGDSKQYSNSSNYGNSGSIQNNKFSNSLKHEQEFIVERQFDNQQLERATNNNKITQNLNKNKNSFMRQKSLKRIGTIPEESMQQSMMSSTH